MDYLEVGGHARAFPWQSWSQRENSVGITMHDPQAYAAWMSLKHMREFACREEVVIDLQILVGSGACSFTPGPLWTFIGHLESLEWTWHPAHGCIEDSFGCFDLWLISFQELRLRFDSAWWRSVGTEHATRPGFEGLSMVDVHGTFRCMADFSPEHLGLMRSLHNGTFFTQDALKHIDGTMNDRCLHCGEIDSVEHRVWQCPSFAEVRQPFLTEGRLNQVEMLQCLRIRGLVPHVEEYFGLLAYFTGLPDTSHVLEDVRPTHILDLFTDGSCQYPQDSRVRSAAWAVL